MASPSDPKPRKGAAAAAWWAARSPEERSARMKQLRALHKTNPGGFKAGDPRTVEAGRKGGKATGPNKARAMKGKQRVKPRDATKQELQSTRGIDQ